MKVDCKMKSYFCPDGGKVWGRISFLLILICSSLCMPHASAAHSFKTRRIFKDTKQVNSVNPKALELLRQIANTYRSINSCSMNVESHAAFENSEIGPEENRSSEILFQRPNKVSITSVGKNGKTVFLSDGKHIFNQVSSNSEVVDIGDAPQNEEAIRIGLTNGASMLFANLFLGHALAIGDEDVLKMGEAEQIKDNHVNSVILEHITSRGEMTIQIFASKNDFIIQKIIMRIELPKNMSVTTTENYHSVHLNIPIPQSTFNYTLPKNITSRPWKDAPWVDAPQSGALISHSDALPFRTLDILGHPFSLNQFRGKIVLLDFWATWCGPCIAEMPNLVNCFEQYSGKGLEIIGVSMDGPNYSHRLLTFIKQHHMKWRQVYDGKGANNSIVSLYKVQAIPFTVLIDRNGKIVASGLRGQQLNNAIQNALK